MALDLSPVALRPPPPSSHCIHSRPLCWPPNMAARACLRPFSPAAPLPTSATLHPWTSPKALIAAMPLLLPRPPRPPSPRWSLFAPGPLACGWVCSLLSWFSHWNWAPGAPLLCLSLVVHRGPCSHLWNDYGGHYTAQSLHARAPGEPFCQGGRGRWCGVPACLGPAVLGGGPCPAGSLAPAPGPCPWRWEFGNAPPPRRECGNSTHKSSFR